MPLSPSASPSTISQLRGRVEAPPRPDTHCAGQAAHSPLGHQGQRALHFHNRPDDEIRRFFPHCHSAVGGFFLSLLDGQGMTTISGRFSPTARAVVRFSFQIAHAVLDDLSRSRRDSWTTPSRTHRRRCILSAVNTNPRGSPLQLVLTVGFTRMAGASYEGTRRQRSTSAQDPLHDHALLRNLHEGGAVGGDGRQDRRKGEGEGSGARRGSGAAWSVKVRCMPDFTSRVIPSHHPAFPDLLYALGQTRMRLLHWHHLPPPPLLGGPARFLTTTQHLSNVGGFDYIFITDHSPS